MATRKQPARTDFTLDDVISAGYRIQPRQDAAVAESAAQPSKRTAIRAAADTGLEVASGAVKGIKFMSDVFGADNAVSTALDDVSKFAKSLQSAQAQGEDARMAQIMKEAEDKGIWEQVKAAASAASEAPIRQSIGAVATGLPMIAASMVPGMREAAWGTRLATMGGLGAAQGVGMVKSSMRDAVYQRAIEEGRSQQEAAELADQAQSYQENPGQIALGGLMGGAATATGFAPAMVRALSPVGANAAKTMSMPTIGKALGMGVLKEVPMEAAQGGHEQLAGNVAQNSAGFATPLGRGVAGSAAMEGMLAAPGGAVGGAFDYRSDRADFKAQQSEAAAAAQAEADAAAAAIRANKQPGSGPLSNAVNAGTEADAQKVEVAGASAAAAIASSSTDLAIISPTPEGSAEFVNPDLQTRKQTLAEQMANPENREKVRARFGDDGLNQVLYYAQAAGRADIPAKTADNMLQVAERMMGEVLLQPLGGDAQLGGMVRDPLTLDAPEVAGAQPLGLGLDQTPSGRFTVDAQGNAMPETAVQQTEAELRAESLRDEQKLKDDEAAILGQQQTGVRNAPEAPLQPVRRTLTDTNTANMLGAASDPVSGLVTQRRMDADAATQSKAEEDQRRFEQARSGTLLNVPETGVTQRPLSVERGMELVKAKANGRALLPQEDGFLVALRKEMGDDAYARMAQVAKAPFLFKKQERTAILKPNQDAIAAWDAANNQAVADAAQQPGDVLNQSGQPFKTKMAADLAAKKTPGAVVPVVGGFVVRPAPAQAAAPTAPPVAATVAAATAPATPPAQTKATPAPEAGPTNQGATNGQGQETLLKAEQPTGAAAMVSGAPVAEQKADTTKPESVTQKLLGHAKRLGILVNETTGRISASNGTVNIPPEDREVDGAISRDHVISHELGHAAMQKRQINYAGFPAKALREQVKNWDDLVSASKAHRPDVWAHKNKKISDHARKPNEVIADAIASVLIGNSDFSLLSDLPLTRRDIGLEDTDTTKPGGFIEKAKKAAGKVAPAPVAAQQTAAEAPAKKNATQTADATSKPDGVAGDAASRPTTHTNPVEYVAKLNREIPAKAPDEKPTPDTLRAAASIPTFQGGKTKMARAITEKVLQYWGGNASKIDTIIDYFGGSGSWGAYMAGAAFPNVKRLVIHEFNPDRLNKIRLFNDRGGDVEKLLSVPEVKAYFDAVSSAIDKKSTFSGSAIANVVADSNSRLKLRVAARDAVGADVFDGLLQAIQDQGNASFGKYGKGKSGSDAVDDILRRTTSNARQAYAQMQSLRERGVSIEYVTGNSYEAKQTQGKNVLAMVDPPYYATKGYNGVSLVGMDTYNDTRKLLDRLKSAGNSVIYTDEAWWEKHDKNTGRTIVPPDAGNQVDGLDAFGQLSSIKGLMGDFFRMPIATRMEVVGFIDGNRNAGTIGRSSSADDRQAQRAWQAGEDAGGLVAGTGRQAGGGMAERDGRVSEGQPAKPGRLNHSTGAGKADSRNSALTSVVRNGGNSTAVLTDIAKNSTNPAFKLVAKAILAKGLPFDLRIRTDFTDGKVAHYSTDGHFVEFDPSMPFNLEQVLLHEAVHAVTSKYVASFGESTPLGKELAALFKLAEQHAKKTGAKFYGLTNADEFLAEVMTNADFAQWLDTVPVPLQKSALSRFVRAVARFFGIQKADGATAQAMDVFERIVLAQSDLQSEASQKLSTSKDAAAVAQAYGVDTEEDGDTVYFGDAEVSLNREDNTYIVSSENEFTPDHRAAVAWAENNGFTSELAKSPSSKLTPVESMLRDALEATGDMGAAKDMAYEALRRQGVAVKWQEVVDAAKKMGRGTRASKPGVDAGQLPDTITVDGVQRPTTNSNGQLIHPTEQGVRNFWRWFSDSKVVDDNGRPLVVYHGTGSDFTEFKVTGTGAATGNTGLYGEGAYFSQSAEYAGKYAVNLGFGDVKNPNIIPAYLSMQNPAFMNLRAGYEADAAQSTKTARALLDAALKDGLGEQVASTLRSYIERKQFASFMIDLYIHYGNGTGVTELMKRAGFDGALMYGDLGKGRTLVEAVAFDPATVKSATGNSGAFDPKSKDIRFSKAAPQPRTPAPTIRAAITKAYGNLLDKLEAKGLVTIAQTEREAIEAAAQARADKTGGDAEAIAGRMMSMAGLDVKYSANGNIEGFFDKQTGKSFLVADNLTAASAPGTLMHEVGIHMAAGGKMDALFKRAGSLLKTGTQNEFIQRVKARMARAGETSDEEAAAYIVTEYENDRAKAPITIGKWLADLTAAVRAWLFSKGIILKADQLTVADISAVARANARSLAKGGPNGRPGGGQAFSRQDQEIRFSLAADMAGNAIDKAKQTADKAMGKDFPRAASMPDLNDDQRSLLGKVGASQSPASDAIKAATDRAGLKIRQGMVDRFAALKDLDERALGQNFIADSITNSAWVLAKMSSAGAGALNAMMKSGRIEMDAQQKVIGLKGAPNGGLTASLQKLGGPAEVERFFAWMAANRSHAIIERNKEAIAKTAEAKRELKNIIEMQATPGKTAQQVSQLSDARKEWEKVIAKHEPFLDVTERLFTEDEVAAGRTLNTGATEAGKARTVLYGQVHAEFQQYRDDVLAIAEQAGIINGENRAMWRDEFYVPFYRVMEDDADRGRSGGNGLSRQEAYKKLKGGKQNLNDLMENTLMNFHHLLSASLKNQAAVQAIKNAEHVGIARKVPEARRDTKTSTFVLVDGKKVFYEVDDPLVFESITTLADPGLNNTAVRVMGAFKRVFTNMTTTTPQSIIANTFRDLLQASATSPTSKNIAKNLKEGIQSYRDEKTRAEMLASGGGFSFGHIYGMGADEVRASLQKTVAGAGLISSPSMIPSILRKGWDAWGNVTDLLENASRAATYAQNVEQMGKLRAAFEARDVMDFSQHGAWPAVRLLVRIVPFLNARLQGLDKLYRSGLKPSILTAMGKGTDTDKQAAARFAMVTGALTLATMALYLVNADDDEYKKLEEWQKDTYWFIRIGENAFFLPKPFEVGAIATIAERTLQQAMDDKATGKLFRERMWGMLMQTFAFNPTPQMFQPLIDVYSNKDAFTGRDIESAGMERMSAGLRSRDSTTAPATAISAISRVFGDESSIAVSPVQADHLIKGYLGGVGAAAAGWIDTMYRAATGQSSPDKAWSEYQPIRRFYRDLDVPVANTRYATLFYDGLKEANRVYADVMELQKLGRPEDAQALTTEKRSVLQMRIALNAQQRRMTEINNRMKEVRRSDKDGEWKRRELDLLTTQKAMITERMGKRIEDARAQ